MESARHCRGCTGPRITHAEVLTPPAPQRRRVVGWTFLGLGGGDDDDPVRVSDESPRPLSEEELVRYYRDQRRRTTAQWLAWIGLAVVAAALIIWQILRPPR